MFSDQVFVEKLVDDYGAVVYPITIVKFVLNKKKIMSCIEKASSDEFKIRGKKFKIDPSDCSFCKQKQEEGVANYCRQHTSLNRVFNADKVLYDEVTECYIYKNEIFKEVNNRLLIIYCPHTKPISGKITDETVRKITPLTIEDENFNGLPTYEEIVIVNSDDWMNKNLKCWANPEFSIVTIPKNEDKSNFVFVCNQ